MAIFITVGEYNNNAGNGEMQPSIKLPSTPPTAPVSPVVNPDGSVTYGGGGGKYIHVTTFYSEAGGSNNCYLKCISVNDRSTPYKVVFDPATGEEQDMNGFNANTLISITGRQTEYGTTIGTIYDYDFTSKKLSLVPISGNGVVQVTNDIILHAMEAPTPTDIVIPI